MTNAERKKTEQGSKLIIKNMSDQILKAINLSSLDGISKIPSRSSNELAKITMELEALRGLNSRKQKGEKHD